MVQRGFTWACGVGLIGAGMAWRLSEAQVSTTMPATQPTSIQAAATTGETSEDPIVPRRERPIKSQFILLLATSRLNDLDLIYPWYRFFEEGYYVVLANPEPGYVTCVRGHRLEASVSVYTLDPERFFALVIPGGPGARSLQENPRVLELVRKFDQKPKKLIGAVGDGVGVLLKAGVLKHRRVTGPPALADEITAAGGYFFPGHVMVDGDFVTVQRTGDVPILTREMIRILSQQPDQFPK